MDIIHDNAADLSALNGKTVAVILCVILVQIVQTIGDVVSDHIDHHER